YTLAVVTTVIVVAALWILDYIEDAIPKLHYRTIVVRREWKSGVVLETIERVRSAGVHVAEANFERSPQLAQVDISLIVAVTNKSGRDSRDSIKLDSESSGGRMNSVLVTAIDDGGAMQRYFGLKKGDSIVEIAPQNGAMMPVKEMDSASAAKDHLLSAFQN